jgi:hypothetical protein
MREKEIEAYFIWTVRRMGGATFKFKSPTSNGVSDQIACLPNGQTWFVELKKPGGRLAPLQTKFATDMLTLKQNYACLWSRHEIDEWARETGL